MQTVLILSPAQGWKQRWKRDFENPDFPLHFSHLRNSFPHKRDPGVFVIEVDSRFRGNDELKPTVGACGLSSLAVNLNHMLFRPGSLVFCAANTCMSRIFCNWQVDFLAIFPALILPLSGIQELRALRLLRLFRFVKAMRYNAAALRFANALKESKEELTIFFAATGIVLYIAAVGIYHFEHEAQPDVFQSVFHALWWAAMTVTTVGYGDVYPITTGGRIFTSIVVLLALGIVAVPAGILATALSAERARVRETKSDRERGDPQSTTPS